MTCPVCNKKVTQTKVNTAAPEDEAVIAEASNPGQVGIDTGHVFRSPRTNQLVRVIAHVGEPRSTAIARVTRRHGL